LHDHCFFFAIEREKAAVADVVIDNSGTRESTEAQVEAA
jgi:dephospho-CoA kinase